MKEYKTLIKSCLEAEIPDALISWGDVFCVTENNEIIMAHNCTKRPSINPEGVLARIKQGEIKPIFKTNAQLTSPVLDGEEIYISTYSIVLNMDTGKATKGILYKINSNDSIEWQYELEGETRQSPVIHQDSIFITDTSTKKLQTTFKNNNLYRFTKKGTLLTKIPYYGGMNKPLILKGNEHIVLDSGMTKSIDLIDTKGNIKNKINVTNVMIPLFSQELKGVFYGAFNNAIIALDEELNTLWEYRPAKGFPGVAPSIDPDGNLYTYCNYSRLVSIDSNGKERWIIDSPGHGTQPYILNNGNILTVKFDDIPAKPVEEHEITHINVFSPTGDRIACTDLPGGSGQGTQSKDGTIYVATRSHRFNKKVGQIWSIKLYSIKIS